MTISYSDWLHRHASPVRELEDAGSGDHTLQPFGWHEVRDRTTSAHLHKEQAVTGAFGAILRLFLQLSSPAPISAYTQTAWDCLMFQY